MANKILWDAHCHLPKVYNQGIRQILMTTSPSEWDIEDEEGYIAYGIHPWIVSKQDLSCISWIDKLRIRLQCHPKALIGEIGLDSCAKIQCKRMDVKQQLPIFLEQLKLAFELNRSVSVHMVGCHGMWMEICQELDYLLSLQYQPKKKQEKLLERLKNGESLKPLKFFDLDVDEVMNYLKACHDVCQLVSHLSDCKLSNKPKEKPILRISTICTICSRQGMTCQCTVDVPLTPEDIFSFPFHSPNDPPASPFYLPLSPRSSPARVTNQIKWNFPVKCIPNLMLHSYTGSLNAVKNLLNLKYLGPHLYFSTSTIVHGKGDTKISWEDRIKNVPEDRWLIESDTSAAVEIDGELTKNEQQEVLLKEAYAKVAAVWNCSEEECFEKIDQNCQRFLGIN